MQTLTGLLQIAERKEKGPATTFDRVHLLLAFLTIGDSGMIGRGALAAKSELGEGAIRTMIKKLREEGYADAIASGCFLTPAGRRVYGSVRKKISLIVPIQDSRLGVGSAQAAVVVRGAAKAVRYGIEQRDSAIRAGAAGTTTYVIRSGKFTIPGGSADCERDFPDRVWLELRSKLKARNGDAVIVCGALQETLARAGALAAALTLL